MPRRTNSVSDQVDELVESFLNGNRKYVARQILRTRPMRKACDLAAAVAVALNDDDRLILRRLLDSVDPKERD